jgi:hypothetical protein
MSLAPETVRARAGFNGRAARVGSTSSANLHFAATPLLRARKGFEQGSGGRLRQAPHLTPHNDVA